MIRNPSVECHTPVSPIPDKCSCWNYCLSLRIPRRSSLERGPRMGSSTTGHDDLLKVITRCHLSVHEAATEYNAQVYLMTQALLFLERICWCCCWCCAIMAPSSSCIYTTSIRQTIPYVLPCAQSSQAYMQIDKNKQRDTQSYGHLQVHVHAHMYAWTPARCYTYVLYRTRPVRTIIGFIQSS